jgi:hypothetical protein
MAGHRSPFVASVVLVLLLAGWGLESFGHDETLTSTRKEDKPAKPKDDATALALTVHECRLAIAKKPKDAMSYMRLQDAYEKLYTREKDLTKRLPMLAWLRQVQRIYAVTKAISLRPKLEAAHGKLAAIYQELNYLDLALKHRQEQLRLAQKAGRDPGETAKEYERRIEAIGNSVKHQEDHVKKAQNEYELAQGDRKGIRSKAELALRLGLAGQARDMLMHSDDVVLDKDAIQLQLHLMVTTGLIEGKDGVRDTLSEANLQNVLGWVDFGRSYSYPAHNWLKILVAAAVGDYAAADASLKPLLAVRETSNKESIKMATRSLTFQLVSFDLAMTNPSPGRLWWIEERAAAMERIKKVQAMPAVKADIFILRGLLALESGSSIHAKGLFLQAAKLKDRDLDDTARKYLRSLESNK